MSIRPSDQSPSSGLQNPESKYPALKERKATRGALQRTRTSKIASLRTAKPEIAYLPTACGGNLRSRLPAVLSCCRPHMGRHSWKFEGYTHQSPHFLVSDARRVEPDGNLPLSVLTGSCPAIHGLVQRCPDHISMGRVAPDPGFRPGTSPLSSSSWPGLTRPSTHWEKNPRVSLALARGWN